MRQIFFVLLKILYMYSIMDTQAKSHKKNLVHVWLW